MRYSGQYLLLIEGYLKAIFFILLKFIIENMSLILLLLLVILKLIHSYECYDNLIIGTATNYNIDKLFSFVTSFRYSGTILNSKLLLLLHDSQRNDYELLHFLKRYNVEIEYVIPDHHIYHFRFQWIRKYLRETTSRFCNVLLTDVRGMF